MFFRVMGSLPRYIQTSLRYFAESEESTAENITTTTSSTHQRPTQLLSNHSPFITMLMMEDDSTTALTDSKATTEPLKCHLLELPAELRLTIYDEILTTLHPDWLKVQSTSKLPSHPLLATSKILRADVGKAYFDRLYKSVAELRKQRDETDARYEALVAERREAAEIWRAQDLMLLIAHTLQKMHDLDKRYIRCKRYINEELGRWREDGFEYGKKLVI